MQSPTPASTVDRQALLPHPPNEELIRLEECLPAVVTEDAVNEVLSTCGLHLRSLSLHTNSSGVINLVFFLDADGTSDAKEVKLVLRVSNNHPFWRQRTTVNEVNCLRWVQIHLPKVPIPRLLRSSLDGPLLGRVAEYVLFERSPGQPASSLLKDDEDLISVLREQVLDVAIALRLQSIGKFSKIGSLDAGGKVGALCLDGPPLGPYESAFEYAKGMLAWAIAELERSDALSRANIDVAPLVHNLRRYMEAHLPDLGTLERELACTHPKTHCLLPSLCHLDLHEGNLMVKDRRLTAVLDWEKAKVAPFIDEYLALRTYWDEEEWPALNRKLEKAGIPVPTEQQIAIYDRLMRVATNAMWAVFWTSSWWKDPVDKVRAPLLQYEMQRKELTKLLKQQNAWN